MSTASPRARVPDKKVVLDSICGPNAEGEVVCLQHGAEPTGETGVTQTGAATITDTDTTSQPTPSTDLPSIVGDGTALTSEGWVNVGASSAAANLAPVVSVGTSGTLTVTLPAKNVALGGTATDSGPYPPQVLWTWTSGPAAPVFANPALAGTTATFPRAGVYVLTLMAADLEYEASATLTVTVLGAPLVQVGGPTSSSISSTHRTLPPRRPTARSSASLTSATRRRRRGAWSPVQAP